MANSRDDVQAVVAATDLLAQGLSTGDISSISDLVTDVTLVLPPGRPTSKGQAAVQFWRNLSMAHEGVRMLSTQMDTIAEGVVRDVGTLSLRAKRTGEQTLCRYSIIWHKAGSTWTIVTMTWNREAPTGGARRRSGDPAGAGGEM